MAKRTNHQDLPRSGEEREALREVGQFWTPPWVANAMVRYVLGDDGEDLFDPAVGGGAFFVAARRWADDEARPLRLMGREIDPSALREARSAGVRESDIANVELSDFVLVPPERKYSAVIANPPYIRHHRIPPSTKETLQRWAKSRTGKRIDGRAGLHIYFLLRALDCLAPSGRLAFILPADTFEGVFAPRLWGWIGRHFRIDAVVTFEHEATPFPGVDTNAVIVLIRNEPPRRKLVWARCTEPDNGFLEEWVQGGMKRGEHPGVKAVARDTSEALQTGLSRTPHTDEGDILPLGALISTMRGIATGDNSFFLLTRAQLEARDLPVQRFVRVVARTRDVSSAVITPEHLEELESKGRPTYLLALTGDPAEKLEPQVQKYLEEGEQRALPLRSLIRSRRPWYRMESRRVPPFLFAYLGRRNSRFIRNEASVVPLTGFLCVYPAPGMESFTDELWGLISSGLVLDRLALVAKSYGSGALKVEPRALERLPVPIEHVPTALRENLVGVPQLTLL